jgi:hypothetical protein
LLRPADRLVLVPRGVVCLLLGAAWLLLVSGCHGGQVRLRVSEDSERYEWRRLVSEDDLPVRCADLLYLIEPPVGYARVLARRLEGFTFTTRVKWNVAVRPVCDGVRRLCRQHNEAGISVGRYEQRKGELLAVLSELGPRKAALDSALAAYAGARALLAGGASGPDIHRAREAMARAQAEAEEALARAVQVTEPLRPEAPVQIAPPMPTETAP